MEKGLCIACKGSLAQFGTKEDISIMKCPNCGLGSTLNLPAQKDDYHRDATYIEEQDLFKNIFQRRVNLINKLYPKRGKILEIGSSTGLMLSLFKQEGWQVLGIEISKASAQFAKQRGIETLTQPFEKIDFKGEKFDAVIINHTLEHLENPVEVIEKIYQILSIGGIVLIDVPNFGSFSAQLLKTNWPLLLPNEHLWHFTAKSLSNILDNNGLTVIYKAMPSGIFDFGNSFQELLTALFGFKKRFFVEIVTVIPSYIMTKLNLGTDLTIIARKEK